MAKVKVLDAGYQRHGEYQRYMEAGFAETEINTVPIGRMVKWALIAIAAGCTWPAFHYLLSIT